VLAQPQQVLKHLHIAVAKLAIKQIVLVPNKITAVANKINITAPVEIAAKMVAQRKKALLPNN